ncbi:MAG: 50S ribosomal protein L23 [bacterium]|nr:50S ribosomal protein L23 [bacterium]
MAFLKRKHTAKDVVTQQASAPTPPAPASAATIASRPSNVLPYPVLLEPYLTEKSSILAELGQYTFLVHGKSEKVQIARAIADRYHVHPVQVRIMRTTGKRVQHGRTTGWRSGVKKAVITLTAGETMPFGVRT